MANHLEYLPDLALQRIVDYLDYGSRRACRLVSWTLKDYMDKTGLSIKLDSRDTESTALSKKVVATEVRILHLESYDLEPDDVRNWKTIILSTAVNFTWLNDHLFQNCFQLRVLILNDDALIGKDFSGKLEPIPSLSSLSELHITVSLWSSGMEDRLLEINSDDYFFDEPPENPYLSAENRIQKNLVYLLTVTRSRVLKVLYISVELRHKTAGKDGSWQYQPLQEFLQAHRYSLENIILPILEFDEQFADSYKAYANPTQLKRIKLNNDIDGRGIKLSKYWTNLLLSQESLEMISIEITQRSDQIPFPWLAALVSYNAKTLTEISLRLTVENLILGPEEFDGTLDMRLFLVAESIRSLKLMNSRGLKIVNLNDLPTKYLTKLILLHTVEIGEDFDGIKFLESATSLTDLYLDNIAAEGHFKDPHHTFQFIKLALRSRTLDKFFFSTTQLKYSLQSHIVTVNESRLEPWIMQVEADERLPNLAGFCMQSKSDFFGLSATTISIMHLDTLEGEPDDKSGSGGMFSAPMSYLEMLEYVEHFGYEACQEQPFQLPINMDSFVVWINQKTETYRVLPKTKSYSKKFKNTKLFKFFMSVILERNGDAQVGPVGLKDLGVTENTLATKNVVNLGFQPEETSNDDLVEEESADELIEITTGFKIRLPKF